MTTHRQPSRRRRLLTPLLALALALAPLGLAAVPADAAARLNVTSSLGSGKANTTGPTNVNVTGTGLQSVKNAFGGIYVVFGHVENTTTWRPSKGGKSGSDYFYVADSQSKNNQGYQRFVAFPGSSTAESANGGVLSANGSFKMSMVIPGPTFTAEASSGGSKKIDCRQVQCGIFTFGAHGVVNGNNETFTPVSFGAAPATGGTTREGSGNSSTSQGATSQRAPTATGGSPDTTLQQDAATGNAATRQGTQQPANEQAGAAGVPQAITNGNPTLGVEQQTVVAGRTLGFAGQGFSPGEQVVATLASGVTAAGPIAAGTFGEVAGAAQIPADMAPGTHKLKLTGAGSGTSVESEFSVMANPAILSPPSDSDRNGVWWALVAVIIAGSILFMLVLSSLIAALVRGKKSPRKKRRSRSRGRAQSRSSGKPPTVGASAPAADQLSPDDSGFSASIPVEPQDLVHLDGPTAQDSWTVDTDPKTSALSELLSPTERERV